MIWRLCGQTGAPLLVSVYLTGASEDYQGRNPTLASVGRRIASAII
jgi:hypothetical protein